MCDRSGKKSHRLVTDLEEKNPQTGDRTGKKTHRQVTDPEKKTHRQVTDPEEKNLQTGDRFRKFSNINTCKFVGPFTKLSIPNFNLRNYLFWYTIPDITVCFSLMVNW